jgi:hypothetical protein
MPEVTDAHDGGTSLHYIQNIHLWALVSVGLGMGGLGLNWSIHLV